MKKVNIVLSIILIITTRCGHIRKSNNQSDDVSINILRDSLIAVLPKDTFITIDVSKKYPKKELILQDIFDVEYIALESTDEFICQGVVLAIGKEIILVKNRIPDGDIFLFDRNGKGIRKINRKGQGPEEYVFYMRAFLDEYNGEIFIDEPTRKIIIYDLHGNFLRRIPKDDAKWGNKQIFNLEYLICKDFSYTDNNVTDNQMFALISKQDGSIVKEFRVFFEKKVIWGITNRSGNGGGAPRPLPIVSYRDSQLLMEPSSDTVYKVSPDYSMTPFMSRVPPIQSMKPGIFLLPCLFTDRYYFMETVKMEYDFTREEGFPKVFLAYDRIENTLFEYTIVNDDFVKKTPVNLTWQETTNNEIAFCQKLEAHELIEAYEKGQLKGQLKEITAALDEDPNPVIMLVKYKK